MTRKDFEKMANIFKCIKPTREGTISDNVYYGKCRLYNDLLSRFNVAFISENRGINQEEFFSIIGGGEIHG